MGFLKRWKLLSSKPIHESPWLSLYDNTYELPNGKIADNYLHVKRSDYVLILAINSKREIIVEKAYRRGVDDFVYELPAGWVNKDEEPLVAAKRELKEETGYEGEGKVVNFIYPEPAFLETKAYIVFLQVKDADQGILNRDDDEDIEMEWMSLDKVEKMILDGDIRDMGFLSVLTSCRYLLS